MIGPQTRERERERETETEREKQREIVPAFQQPTVPAPVIV
jgi:hypothetical protein